MTLLRLFVCVMVVISGLSRPAATQSLTEVDCLELEEQLGVVPRACQALGNDLANTMTPSLRESLVFFRKGGTQLDSAAREQLSKIAKILETPPMQQACLKLVGHSDSFGSATANLRLSQRRAQAVSVYLSDKMSEPSRIKEVLGMGEERPIQGFDAGAPENRRVEILVKDCALP